LIDSFPYGNGTVHEKIVVIDSSITVTGSANWSLNANVNNDENTLILYDPAIARRFMAEIVARHLEAGGTYPPAVNEPAPAPGLRRRIGPNSPALLPGILPAGSALYDALGRRTVPRAARAGVYFVRTPEGATGILVIVR
jgi:phosphatidylserine/phosphatidylglycerophosphate/cardiolipin synthase-like enzyme